MSAIKRPIFQSQNGEAMIDTIGSSINLRDDTPKVPYGETSKDLETFAYVNLLWERRCISPKFLASIMSSLAYPIIVIH